MMPMFSPNASRVLGGGFIADASASDLYEPLRSLIEDGWVLKEGAVLPAAFRNSYVGSRSRHPVVLDWELPSTGEAFPMRASLRAVWIGSGR
ncbi:hypothetical protein [Spirillospora sp. NPDC048819]|uniref:hypothetical protein n=1 Tax=Spirillospora sp. NPDC048819 TaxID=3155268 RepID=UPI0034069CB7